MFFYKGNFNASVLATQTLVFFSKKSRLFPRLIHQFNALPGRLKYMSFYVYIPTIAFSSLFVVGGTDTHEPYFFTLCVVCCRLRHETTMYYAALISLTLFKHTMEPSLSFFSSNGHLKHPHCISIIIRVSLHQQLGKVCCTLTSKREMKTNVGEINEVSHPVSNILFLSGLHLHSLCG